LRLARAASTRRDVKPLTGLQLTGGAAPCPTLTSNEDPLIKKKMRTFPEQHPSLSSVKQAVATGCPALVHNQMSSANWKSTCQATIGNQEPTEPKRREGKRMTPALFGSGDLFVEPIEMYVAPSNAPPTSAPQPTPQSRTTDADPSPLPRRRARRVAHKHAAHAACARCTVYRDQRVFKHMGTLTRSGHW
jgi:hypothetical protein